AELLADDVDPGDHLGDRMLDLHARVHLEEVEAAVRPEQELDGAGVVVVDGPGQAERGASHLLPEGLVHGGRGCLLHELLAAALQRALALAKMDSVAVMIGEELDLDVTSSGEEGLEVDGPAAEHSLAAPPACRPSGRCWRCSAR